jgi:hypothetical protein
MAAHTLPVKVEAIPVCVDTLGSMNVIEWLRSPEGEAWSLEHHRNNPVMYSHGWFASLKDDHECGAECEPRSNQYYWLDKQIRSEIREYGMNALAA